MITTAFGARRPLVCLSLAVGWIVSAPLARAQETEKAFFAGKTVRMVVGSGTGGGYDIFSRMIAPYLSRILGTTVIVENQPGAGGLVALNRLFVAPPDGLQISLSNGTSRRLSFDFAAFKTRLDEQELKRQVFSLIILRRLSPLDAFSTSGSLANSGNLLANGGTLVISEAITGNGSATISGSNSVLDLQMASTQNVTFASGAHGILQLENAPSYTGTIAGLVSGDAIDLTNFQFSGNPIISGITGTGAVGTPTNVTVQDAGQSVTLELLNQTANQYSTLASAYTLTSDNTLAHGTLFALHP